MAEYQSLLVSEEDGIARIVINRPAKLNALNRNVLDELGDAVASLSRAAPSGLSLIHI